VAAYRAGPKLRGKRVLTYEPTLEMECIAPMWFCGRIGAKKKLDQTIKFKVKSVRLQPSDHRMQLIGSAAVVLKSVL
jgi:hypothetical protein